MKEEKGGKKKTKPGLTPLDDPESNVPKSALRRSLSVAS
jgi:hypothetical protein